MNDSEEPLRLNGTTFKGDVFRLVSGTAIAQGIVVLAAPVMARLYAPEAFGMAALFASLSAVLCVISCLRYELSIVLPESDREAANLFAVSVSFGIIIALITSLLVWLFGPILVTWVQMPALVPFLWLIPVVVVIHALYVSLNHWNTRTKRFTRLSIARVSGQVSTTSAALGAGFLGFATGGAMIAANVGGQAMATSVLGGQILRENGRFFVQNIRPREMLAALRRYKKFPIFSTWEGLLNTASWQLPVFILGGFFAPAIVGFYALGFRILQVPMRLIGASIGQVFHQRAAEAKLEGKLAPLVEDVFQRLAMVSLFPMLTLSIIGRDLFIVVFGEPWSEAGLYTQILSIWAFVWFISSPMSTLFGVMNRQEHGLKIQIAIFISRLAALSLGVLMNSAVMCILLFSISGFLVYAYMLYKVLQYAGVPVKAVLWKLSKNLAEAIPFLSLTLFFSIYFENSLYVIGVASIVGCAYVIYNRMSIKYKATP